MSEYDQKREHARQVLTAQTLRAAEAVYAQTKRLPSPDDVKRELGVWPADGYHLDPYIHSALEIITADIVENAIERSKNRV